MKRSTQRLPGLPATVVAMAILVAALAAILGYRQVYGDLPEDAWTTRVSITDSRAVNVPVARALRFATSPAGMRLLDQRRFVSRSGEVALAREGDSLVVRCAPCTLEWRQLASRPLKPASITLRLARSGDRLRGGLEAGALRIAFTGRLDDRGAEIDWTLPPTDFASVLAPLAPVLPELARASVAGTLAASGRLRLPEGEWSFAPEPSGIRATGLGSERLRHGPFSQLCREADGSHRWLRNGDGAPDWIPLGEMGRWLPRAVLAAEDANFRNHPGYDLDQLRNAQTGGGPLRGASTLTQQLAKSLYTGADPTLVRKLRELLYALDMESALGKRRILALYLNTVDWGPGICGARQAARHYFGREPANLTPKQAAWLAGILRNPHRAYAQEYVRAEVDEKRLDWTLKEMRLPRRLARRAQTEALAFAPAPAAIGRYASAR